MALSRAGQVEVGMLGPTESDEGDGEVEQGEDHHHRAGQVSHQVAQVEQQLIEREAGSPDQVADRETEHLDDGQDGEDQLGPGAGLGAREDGRQEASQGQNYQQHFLECEVDLRRKIRFDIIFG